MVFVLPEHGKFEFHHVRSIRSFAGTKLLGAPYFVHVQGREGCAAGQLADNLDIGCLWHTAPLMFPRVARRTAAALAFLVSYYVSLAGKHDRVG